MKHSTALLLSLVATPLLLGTPIFLIGCFHNSPLAEVADKIPEKIQCNPLTATDAVTWLKRYEDPANRTSVEEELRKIADTDPTKVACILLESERLVRERGDRKSEIYQAILQGLKDLKVFQ